MPEDPQKLAEVLHQVSQLTMIQGRRQNAWIEMIPGHPYACSIGPVTGIGSSITKACEHALSLWHQWDRGELEVSDDD